MSSTSEPLSLLPGGGSGTPLLSLVEDGRPPSRVDRDGGRETELDAANREIESLRNQLAIAEKLAALGRMTGGIAHEINSPLAGILNSLSAARGFIEEYRSSIDDPEITAEDHRAIARDILGAVRTAETAGAKVAQIVRSIKDQTRPGEGGRGDFDPADEVDGMIALLQHELKRRRIGIFADLERGHTLRVDQGKFSVVLRNLISNAVDSYDGEAGEVWVRLRADDGRLLVSVADRGGGIPEEIRERIFDYLFTTKEVGRGTGLGLAMVHDIVRGSFGGEIALDTEPGAGTTFTISIPLRSTPPDHGA